MLHILLRLTAPSSTARTKIIRLFIDLTWCNSCMDNKFIILNLFRRTSLYQSDTKLLLLCNCFCLANYRHQLFTQLFHPLITLCISFFIFQQTFLLYQLCVRHFVLQGWITACYHMYFKMLGGAQNPSSFHTGINLCLPLSFWQQFCCRICVADPMG